MRPELRSKRCWKTWKTQRSPLCPPKRSSWDLWVQSQELRDKLVQAWEWLRKAHRRQVEDHLCLQKDRMVALQEVQRWQKSLLDQQDEQIHQLEMERCRLHNDTQEPKDNIPVFCRVRPVLPEESERQRGLQHLHFSPQNSTTLIVTQPDEVKDRVIGTPKPNRN
ncbi:kinesin-like protein KIFC1 [Pipra filicauda]|uniref:Kinesin-like protein KIFC1 n=1 Tax=Pipra filicauda TaxID=649802 RepID=A0A7R5L7A0_9PASS|nr:kinesin-like protein KIFC1 [Pipra filicauda]